MVIKAPSSQPEVLGSNPVQVIPGTLKMESVALLHGAGAQRKRVDQGNNIICILLLFNCEHHNGSLV